MGGFQRGRNCPVQGCDILLRCFLLEPRDPRGLSQYQHVLALLKPLALQVYHPPGQGSLNPFFLLAGCPSALLDLVLGGNHRYE